MNRRQRQALSRLLTVALEAELSDDIEMLRPLLLPRQRRGREILPHEDQLPMPF